MPIDKNKKLELEHSRVEYAVAKLEEIGYDVSQINDGELKFEYKGSVVTFFPYTGWHTGKTIKDGRGIDKLLKQITLCQ